MTPTWETLYRIRKLNVYKFASWAIIVVPLFASAHVAIQQHLHLVLPVPTNLAVIYFSTTLFFASSLLIDVCCPNEIKDHGDFENFFQFMRHKIETASIERTDANSRRERLLNEIALEAPSEAKDNPPSGHQIYAKLDNFFSEEAYGAVLALAMTIWTTADEKLPVIRWITATGFVMSAGAAAYLSFYDAPRRVFMALV